MVDIERDMVEKPKCSISNCERTALVFIGDKWYCGECISNWFKSNSKKLHEDIQSANG